MDGAVPKSGLAQAGEILLLVGAIVRAAMLLFMIIYLVVMGALLSSVWDEAQPVMFEMLGGLGILLFVMLGMMVASVIVGFAGWQKARRREFRKGGILGIVAAMLPPLDVILLLGGIFLLVCDEAKAEAEADAPRQA